MVLGNTSGQMGVLTRATGLIIIWRVMEFTLGKMVANMKANGEQIECMEKVLSHGLMEGSLLENMLMTKRKDMESLFGLMEGVIVENGLMESNMEKEPMLPLVGKRSMENGEMGKGIVG